MARLGIVAGYLAVFWALLPYALWQGGLALDRALGWSAEPTALGVLPLVPGLWFLAGGMRQLWLRGGGLPIGALPPPRFTRHGPYRLARHPIYLGFNAALLGAGLLLGSPGLAWVVAPLFLPLWIGYALLEEGGLVRRFGSDYRRYQRQVGLLPRPGLYRLSQALLQVSPFRPRVTGRARVPRRGPVVLVFNHASYLDPAYVSTVTWRPIHYLTTAQAYRQPWLQWIVNHYVNVPVRRYRQDPVACREMLRLLAEGEVIGLAVEGERAVLGGYQGVLREVAGIVVRLNVPVIPVGLSGTFDAGPRWADTVRPSPVQVAVGPELVFGSRAPADVIDDAIRGLLQADPQPVRLPGLSREKLARVIWCCPECHDEVAWRAADLACGACGARYRSTDDGWFEDRSGRRSSLAALGELVQQGESPAAVEIQAAVARERSLFGPIESLEPLGEGMVRFTPETITFGELRIAVSAVRSVSTERADILQVATRDGMWQFRPDRYSVFRLARLLERWRPVRGSPPGAARTSPRSP